MDIYDFLIVKKRGGAYRKEQVTNSSLYNHPLNPNKQVRGNSRIWGDVSAENQKIVIDKIISLGSRFHLSYKDIAYALLLCYAESGFNPDAAAGTTSASGLAQYTRDTMKSFSARAKKYLSQNLTMTPQNVFEVDIGVYGVIAAYLFNKDLAMQWIEPNNSPKFWQTIYMLHHDGPGYYTDDRGKERAIKGKWRADAIKTYNTKILPKLSKLEALLTNSTSAVKVQLEDSNGQPVQNKEYVVAAPANTSKAPTPAKLSTDRKVKKSYNIIHGKTDAHGFTKELVSAIGCELIVLLCSNKPKKLGKAVSEEEYKKHIVKKGDTLSKIARNNGTTVAELAKDNQIKNPDKITTGQKLIIKRKYLRHKPSGSAIKEILEQAGLGSYSKDSIIYAQNHVVKPDGSTSASAGHKKENTVTLRTTKPAENINKTIEKGQSPKDTHETSKDGTSKEVSTNQATFEELPWITIAREEIGVKEIKGGKHNPRVIEYHSTTGKFKKDEVPWCSSFVNWVIKKAGMRGTNNAMAVSWKRWGKILSSPAYGSVGVHEKSNGQGHVGFIVGQTKDGKYLISLGGNQNDEVNLTAYRRKYFAHFRYPNEFEENLDLPVMSSGFKQGGRTR